MKNSQKGSATVVALLILVVLLMIGFGSYVYLQKTTNNNQVIGNASSSNQVDFKKDIDRNTSKNIVGSWAFETSEGPSGGDTPLDERPSFFENGTFMTTIYRGPGDSVAGYDGTWNLKNGGLSLTFNQLQKEWFFEKIEATPSTLVLYYKGNTKLVYKKIN